MSKSNDWATWERSLRVKGCPASCWVRNLPLPNDPHSLDLGSKKNLPTVEESIREAAAMKLYRTIKPWQTRILRIDPSSRFAEPVVCVLLEADVIVHDGLGVVEEDGPREVPYEALSYTWGAPVFSHPVQINDIEFFITENLDSALRHLRLTDAVRYLWVDALCINQFDNKEKSIQVGRMFSIYQKARRVVAWNSGWDRKKSTILTSVLENLSGSPKHSDDCLARFEILRRFLVDACEPPLFKRTWVRQEAFAARDLVMQFGDLFMTWRDYERIKDFVASINGRVISSPESGLPDFTDALYLKSPYNAIMTLVQPDYKHDHKSRLERNQAARNSPVSLLDALVFSSSFGVTDPRDLVYGILGFTTVPISQGDVDINRPSLKVDYSCSISKVFQDVTMYEIARTESLSILDFVGSRAAQSDLPSWTPDWRSYDPNLAQHRVLNRINSWKYGFIDVQKIGVSWKPAPQPPDGNGILFARGVVLGVLQDNIDEATAWAPFISPGFEAGFRERFGGRSCYSESLFPGVKADYRSTFHSLFHDGNFPLYEGEVIGVKVSDAGRRMMTALQLAMLEEIKQAVRGRVIAPPEPIRGNHILGLASPNVSISAKGSRSNDIIVLLEGSPFPVVLRHHELRRYALVGRSIFPLWFEHKSASFDDFRRNEIAWSSNNAVYTETSNILESRLLWPERMASIWKSALRDPEFLDAFEEFQLK